MDGWPQVFFDWLSTIRLIWKGYKSQLCGSARKRDASLKKQLDVVKRLKGIDRLATPVAFSSCVAVSGLWSRGRVM